MHTGPYLGDLGGNHACRYINRSQAHHVPRDGATQGGKIRVPNVCHERETVRVVYGPHRTVQRAKGGRRVWLWLYASDGGGGAFFVDFVDFGGDGGLGLAITFDLGASLFTSFLVCCSVVCASLFVDGATALTAVKSPSTWAPAC